MGGTSTRCCGTCDKQHTLKFGSEGDRQVYAPWDDAVGSEHWPDPGPPLARIEGPMAGGQPECAALGRCCTETMPAEQLPKTPPAAGLREHPPEGKGRSREAADVPAEQELLVEISKRAPGEDLGMKVLHRNIGVLVVAEIYLGGAVEAANEANARARRGCLEVNDLIVTVNGVGGDDAAMAEECKRSVRLLLGVRRGALKAAALPPALG